MEDKRENGILSTFVLMRNIMFIIDEMTQQITSGEKIK